MITMNKGYIPMATKKLKPITLRMLTREGACGESRTLFKNYCGQSFVPTIHNLRTLKDLPKRISFSRLKGYLSTCLVYSYRDSYSNMDLTFLNECDRLWDAVYTTRIPEITKCAVLEERLEEIDDEIEIEVNKQILRLFVKYYKENPKNWIKIKKP
jgi:hypothetical protein